MQRQRSSIDVGKGSVFLFIQISFKTCLEHNLEHANPLGPSPNIHSPDVLSQEMRLRVSLTELSPILKHSLWVPPLVRSGPAFLSLAYTFYGSRKLFGEIRPRPRREPGKTTFFWHLVPPRTLFTRELYTFCLRTLFAVAEKNTAQRRVHGKVYIGLCVGYNSSLFIHHLLYSI